MSSINDFPGQNKCMVSIDMNFIISHTLAVVGVIARSIALLVTPPPIYYPGIHRWRPQISQPGWLGMGYIVEVNYFYGHNY